MADISKTLKGRLKTTDSQLNKASELASVFRGQLTKDVDNAALPLMACYPVERSVLDIPLRNAPHLVLLNDYNQLNGYDNALQGINFRRFFEWFIYRQDCENENTLDKLEKQLDHISNYDTFLEIHHRLNNYKEEKDPQLMAVRSAINAFMGGFDNLRVKHHPRLQMLIDKNGKMLDVAQLSQGEKSMMALVGDIARRLAILNPALDNPLEGFGIVLIDEIDLHLHPKWQRAIVGNLNRTFPNCQFILTTHSPIIISESPGLLCYSLEEGGVRKLENLYGMDVNQVLLQDMDVPIRNADIQQDLDNLRDNLQDGQLTEAKALLAALTQKIADDNLELSKAKLLIRYMEAKRAVNP